MADEHAKQSNDGLPRSFDIGTKATVGNEDLSLYDLVTCGGEEVHMGGFTKTGYFSGDGGLTARWPQPGDAYYHGRPPKIEAIPGGVRVENARDLKLGQRVQHAGDEWTIIGYHDNGEYGIRSVKHANWLAVVPRRVLTPLDTESVVDDGRAPLKYEQRVLSGNREYVVADKHILGHEYTLRSVAEPHEYVVRNRDQIRTTMPAADDVVEPKPEVSFEGEVRFDQLQLWSFKGEAWWPVAYDGSTREVTLKHRHDAVTIEVHRDQLVREGKVIGLAEKAERDFHPLQNGQPRPMTGEELERFTRLAPNQLVLWRPTGSVTRPTWKVVGHDGRGNYSLLRVDDPDDIQECVPRRDIEPFVDDEEGRLDLKPAPAESKTPAAESKTPAPAESFYEARRRAMDEEHERAKAERTAAPTTGRVDLGEVWKLDGEEWIVTVRHPATNEFTLMNRRDSRSRDVHRDWLVKYGNLMHQFDIMETGRVTEAVDLLSGGKGEPAPKKRELVHDALGITPEHAAKMRAEHGDGNPVGAPGKWGKRWSDSPQSKEDKEAINHPSHYTHGKFEAIDVIEDWQLNFNLGNAVKYICRAGHKGDLLENLKKSAWYLNREIHTVQKAIEHYRGWDEDHVSDVGEQPPINCGTFCEPPPMLERPYRLTANTGYFDGEKLWTLKDFGLDFMKKAEVEPEALQQLIDLKQGRRKVPPQKSERQHIHDFYVDRAEKHERDTNGRWENKADPDVYEQRLSAEKRWHECECEYCNAACDVDRDPELVWHTQAKCECYEAVQRARASVEAYEKKVAADQALEAAQARVAHAFPEGDSAPRSPSGKIGTMSSPTTPGGHVSSKNYKDGVLIIDDVMEDTKMTPERSAKLREWCAKQDYTKVGGTVDGQALKELIAEFERNPEVLDKLRSIMRDQEQG